MLRFRVSHAAWLHHKHACSLWALELLPPDPTSGQHQDGHPHFQSEVLKSFRWTKYPPHSKPSKTSCYLNFTLHNQFADFLSSTSFFHAQQCAGNHVFLQDHLPVFFKGDCCGYFLENNSRGDVCTYPPWVPKTTCTSCTTTHHNPKSQNSHILLT